MRGGECFVRVAVLERSGTKTEPPRVVRRLLTLRGWSYDRETQTGEVPGGDA